MVFLTLLVSACGQPVDAQADLERIKRNSNFEQSASALQKFVEERLARPTDLQRDLAAAGFVHSTSPADNDPGCELYRWSGDQKGRPVVLTASICDGRVSAGAGVPNP